jgi:hypothetical protein
MGGKNRRYVINEDSPIRISKSYCADMRIFIPLELAGHQEKCDRTNTV